MAKALNNQDLIRKLKPNPLKPFYRRAVHSHVGSGLYVKVTAAAGRKYVARYIIKGKPVDVTIGNAMSMTLQEAKDKHLEGYNLAADGLDPRLSWQARIKSNEQATTMQSLFDEWLQFYGATPSQRSKRIPAPKTVREHQARWNRYCKAELGPLLVRDVNRQILVPFLRKLATTVPVEARHQLNVLRAMLSYAEDCQLIDDNALRGVTSSKIGGSAGAIGKRFLTVPEIVRVWQTLETQEEAGLLGKHLSTAIKILILTGARRDEVAGMRWQELDLQSGTWEINSERTKNRRPHTVYLAPETIQLLQNLEMFEGNDFVFSGQGRGTAIHPDSINTAIARLLGSSTSRTTHPAPLQDFEPFSPHDLRRSASTGWSQRCGAANDVIEAMLNHSKPRLEETYNKNQRQEQQKRVWHEWAYVVTAVLFESNGEPTESIAPRAAELAGQEITPYSAAHSIVMTTLVNALAAWLKEKNMSRVAAAQILGAHPQRLEEIEKGLSKNFTFESLSHMLAKAGKEVTVCISDI
ncbi:tyrosine-type recombinase/integrase [Halopseudomonas pachastrellae]|nr:tyrosine-type recombinase/integrase [Halopseudomonas pachastrellae]